MDGAKYIKEKQKTWAWRNRIALAGSMITKGDAVYTISLNDNLFEPLMSDTRSSLESGDGNELIAPAGALPKIHALHSSSALGINMFQYWKRINRVKDIAAACGLCSMANEGVMDMRFEEKLIIDPGFDKAPNIDIVIIPPENSRFKIYAIESKFSEPYREGSDHGLKPKYLNLNPDPWQAIPNLYALAQKISPSDNIFHHLHAAQLIKHILGLKQKFSKHQFRLLYVYYDVFGEQGCVHRKEIDAFKTATDADGIHFHALSYQELIIRLIDQFYPGNENYMDYISNRYL